MQQKSKLRKKYFKIRKENYFEVDKKFFSPLYKLIKNLFGNDVNGSIMFSTKNCINRALFY